MDKEMLLRGILTKMLREDPQLLIQICIEANQYMERLKNLLKDHGIDENNSN